MPLFLFTVSECSFSIYGFLMPLFLLVSSSISFSLFLRIKFVLIKISFVSSILSTIYLLGKSCLLATTIYGTFLISSFSKIPHNSSLASAILSLSLLSIIYKRPTIKKNTFLNVIVKI